MLSFSFIQRAIRFGFNYVKRTFDRKRFAAPEIPILSFETTNVCNSKCVFCANPVMQRPKVPLNMEHFKKTVDEYAAMGGTQMEFNTTIGDPLLDRLIFERAKYVKKYPQFETSGFVTTLQWLHLFDIEEVFESGITWIAVSTILTGREKYKEFFGVDKYDQMLKNLVLLMNETKKRNHPLFIGVDIKPNDQTIEEIMQHPDYQMIRGLAQQDLDQKLRERGFYVDDWLGAVKLPPYLKKRPLYPRPFRPCQLLYKGLIVYSNGNIGACSCRDFEANSDLIIGNIAQDRLPDVWSGKKLSDIRSNWLKRNQVPNICKSCRHYLY